MDERVVAGVVVGFVRCPGQARQQGPVVQLAGAGQREGVHDGDGHGTLVCGQVAGERRRDVRDDDFRYVRRGLWRCGVGPTRGAEGDQFEGAVEFVPAGDHPAVGDGADQADDLPLDLGRLDAVAPHLDLPVEPPAELHEPVLVADPQVSGAVQPDPLADDVDVRELLGGQGRFTEVAVGQSVARGTDLPGLPDGAGAVAVEEEDGGAGHLPPEGDAARAGAVRDGDGVGGGEHRVLDRAVAVDQDRAGEPVEEAVDVAGGQAFTADHQLGQAAHRGQVLVDDQVEQAAGQPHRVHSVVGDQRAEGLGRQERLIDQDTCSAVVERGPEFEGERVPRQRRREGDDRVPVEAREGAGPEEPGRGPVRSDHALGPSRGAGREEHRARVGVPHRHGGAAGGAVRRAVVGRVPHRCGQRRDRARPGDHEGRAKLVDDGVEAGGRPVGVEQRVGGPAFENGEQSDDQVHGARHQDRHEMSRSDTGGGEPVG